MHRSYSLRLVAGAALVITLPFLGNAPGWGEAGTPTPLPAGQTKTPPSPPGPDDITIAGRACLLADTLSKLVSKSPDRYAGVAVPRPDSNDLLVFLRQGADGARADRDVQAAVQVSAFPEAHVTVVTVPRSLNELTRLHAQVDAAYDVIVKLGGDVRGTGPDPATGKIKVFVAGDEQPVLAGLGALFDDVELRPVQVKRDTGGGALLSGQHGDRPPWQASGVRTAGLPSN